MRAVTRVAGHWGAVAAALAIAWAAFGGAAAEAVVPVGVGLRPDVLPVGGAVPAVAIDQRAGQVWSAVATGGRSDAVVEFGEATQSVTATFSVPPGADAVAVDQQAGTVWVSSAGRGRNSRQIVTEITESSGATTSVDLTAVSGGGRLVGVVCDPGTAMVFAVTSAGRLIGLPEAAPGRSRVLSATTVIRPGAFALDPADGRIWITSLPDGTVSAFTEDGAPAPGLPQAIRAGAGPGSIAIDPGAGLVWVANLAAGTLTEISERAGTVLAPAIKAGSGLAAVAVSPDQARPRRGIVWTVGSFLPFTFREFSEADTPARLTAAGPADVAGVPYTLAVDAVNGQVYEGTSEGLSPFLPTPPVLTATDLFWWTNVPSADSAPATPAVFFPPPRFSIAGAPSWVHVDPISGTLHGLPGKTGKFSFTVFARNTLGLGSAARFTVTVGVAPVFRSPPSATFVAGLKSAFQMVVTGVPKPAVQLPGPGTLPAGLTFTSAGLLSGTPAAGTEGTYQFFAAASNDPTLAIVVVQQFTLTVVRGRAPTFISPAHARLRAGEHAVVTIRTSGVPVPKVKVTGRLPRGLAVRPGKPGTAVIAGRPARSDAHHRFRIKTTAVNGLGHVTRTLVITVSPPAKRDRPIRARLTAHVTRLPGWEARLLRSLPASLRGRALRTLSERPGTAGCISVAGQSEHGQAWIAGYANVTKLRGAALVGPAFADIVALTKEVICPRSVTEFSTEVPSFRGKPEFPPMRATFLAFGFIPVTATIQISQVGVGHILLTLAGAVSATPPYIVQAKARLNIRVMTVKVNGVALPVGARCRTMSPGAATLNNVNPTGLPGRNFWDTFTGGPLSGTITVPRFAGCGASGDDLDAILDASISGPGNFSKLIQGMPCIFGNLFDTTCPPQVPEPRR